MRNTIQFIAFFCLVAIGTAAAQQSPTQIAYIERYKEIAVREMERVGVPASIKLAQGLLESNSGQSSLARRGNNHFGMKCGSAWKGGTIYKEDDDYNDKGELIKSCFRSYRNGQASYVAHSEFLRDPRKAFRYGFLFRLDPTDYQRWAHGLKQAGYATSPTYPQKLISLIERYQLYQYDTNQLAGDGGQPNTNTGNPNWPSTGGGGTPVGGGDRPNTPNTNNGNDRLTILTNNDVRYTVVGQGESLDDIARRVDGNVRNLISYNENLRNVSQNLETGTQVYIQPKRNGYRGRQKYHDVKAGETMFAISQEYGVKLSKLLRRNRLNEDQEPAAKERIKLRGWKVRSAPKLSTGRTTPAPRPNTAPELPNGDLDMEEPTEVPDTTPPPSTTTTPPPPPVVQPTGSTSDNPVIIINQGSQPAPTTSTPAPNTTTAPPPPVIVPNTPAPTTPPPSTTIPAESTYHTVVSGDTLYNISRRYNTTVDALKSLNGLTNNNISLGARLRVK